MRRPSIVVFLLLLALCTGCGARTGLLWQPESDAGVEEIPDAMPDVFGPYPCNYGATGELTPVRPEVGTSIFPQLEWGEGRLAVGFWAAEDWRRFTGMCTTSAEEGLRCSRHEIVAEDTLNMGRLAWNGRGFGLVWPRLTEEGSELYFREVSTLGETLSDPRRFFVGPDEILSTLEGLVWMDGHYLVAWSSTSSSAPLPLATRVQRLHPTGRVEASAIPDLDPLAASATVAADGDVAALAWIDGEGLRVRAIEGLDGAEVVVPAVASNVDRFALALRGSIAAVGWSEVDEPAFRLHLVLADLSRSIVGPRAEIHSGIGWIIGLDLLGVYEGFMVGWTLSDGSGTYRVGATPTRVHGGLEIEPRSPITLYEGPSAVISPGGTEISLAHDGTDVYVGADVLDPASGLVQVHIQRLGCHR